MQPTFYKAVVVRDGRVYTIGMGPAKRIRLATKQMTNGGEYGISAAKSISGAKHVIGFVLKRKVKPKPVGHLAIATMKARDKMFENRWRVIYRSMQVMSVNFI
jgi:hypothetical protein